MNPKPYFSPAPSIPGSTFFFFFCIDEFIIGFKRMISVHFKQMTKKNTTQDWVLNV